MYESGHVWVEKPGCGIEVFVVMEVAASGG